MPSDVGSSIKGLIARALPVPRSVDAQRSEVRVSGYGDQYTLGVMQTKHPLADEGSYFVATNPTPGTTISTAASVQTTFSATVPHFVIKNNDTSSGTNKRLYLDYIKIMLFGTVPATVTACEVAVKTDTGNRVPTAGSQTITPVNTNADSTNASIAQVYAPSSANLTAPAEVSAKLVGRGKLRIPNGFTNTVVAGDEYILDFGTVDPTATVSPLAAAATAATSPGKFVEHFAPVVIGPQQFILVHLWFTGGATNAFAHEFEIGMWER